MFRYNLLQGYHYSYYILDITYIINFLFTRRLALRGVAERVDAALDRRDDNVARAKVRVDGPGTVELGLAANLVVLGVDVKVGNGLDAGTRVVVVEGGDVDEAETAAVVGLVGDAVEGVLVVVDGLVLGLDDAAEDGVAEVLDVDNVGGGALCWH